MIAQRRGYFVNRSCALEVDKSILDKEENTKMPAIRIKTDDKELAEETLHTIMRNCRSSYIPERIYVIGDRDHEWLMSKGLPIEVLSEEEVQKSVSGYKRK
ncbi:hypothetical protein C6502_19945 [Candidatus Poribacteria bacterium]|nr:MAG: hypothetical protein C6502_19945 [Candidatus Poribacteria bacterium]